MHSYLHGHPALVEAVRKLEQLHLDQFELYLSRKTSTKIDSKNLKVDALTRSDDVGLAIRIIKKKRLGFSYTTSLEKDAVDRAVRSAVEIAAIMPEDPFQKLHSFSESVYPDVDDLDTKGLSVPIAEKIAMAQRLEEACRKADKRIAGVRSASLSETAYEVFMVDSHNEHLQHKSSVFTASISCKAEDQGDAQMGYEFDFANELDRLDVLQTGRLAAHWATELLGAGQVGTMKCPAVIRNSVVAELLEFLSSSFSAEDIAKGRSMLGGRERDRVFSELVTLVDDGLLAGGLATSPFDGEGVPSSRTTLIDGGFFANALYDTYYANKLGKSPTGSAVRGIKAPPTIGTSNLYMEKGKKTFDGLVDGISKGILITHLMGVHTANPVTGDFSLGASGILIKGGKLTRPVKGFAVAGNIMEVFRKITDISNDLRFFGTVGAPSVRISELSIGGT